MKQVAGPRCQLHCRLTRPSLIDRLRTLASRLRQHLRLRSRWQAWRRGAAEKPGLGAASRHAVGSWVRIRAPGQIFATLDPHKCLRGLRWNWQLWPYCGSVHQVLKPVQRIMDDGGRMRPISGTVVLDTVPCSGPLGDHGCGRSCPMMFRDEWLEAVPAPPPAANSAPARLAMVRSLAEIRATLDAAGCRSGLLFMPEMAALAGRRFTVQRKVDKVLEGGRYQAVAEPLYLLEGLFCSGDVLGDEGPCHRACRLLWHADWLHLDPPESNTGQQFAGSPT